MEGGTLEGGQPSFEERVVGGHDTVPGKYPWIVLLRYFLSLIFSGNCRKKHEKYYFIIIIVRFQKNTGIFLYCHYNCHL